MFSVWQYVLPHAVDVCLKQAYTHSIFFDATLPNHFDALFNPKNASETNAMLVTLRHPLVNLQNVRVLAPPMLFDIYLRLQCNHFA